MNFGLGRKLTKNEFHSIWSQYFAPYYEQITLNSLNEESHCTLCGHIIYNQIGLIEKTRTGDIICEGKTFQVPYTMKVGCDCYGLKGSGIFKIINRLNDMFPNLKVQVRKGKIKVDVLCKDLHYEMLKNKPAKHYKMFLPMKYLTCGDEEWLQELLDKSDYPYLILSQKNKQGWSDVFYEWYERPISDVRTTHSLSSVWLHHYMTQPEGNILIIDLNILK